MNNICFPVPLGSIPELPAESCLEIKASEGGQAVSGTYWFYSIVPDNVALAYCDMKTEGNFTQFPFFVAVLRCPVAHSFCSKMRKKVTKHYTWFLHVTIKNVFLIMTRSFSNPDVLYRYLDFFAVFNKRKSSICSARVKEIQGRGSFRLKIVITIYNNLSGKLWAKYINLIPRWATFKFQYLDFRPLIMHIHYW